MVMPTGNSALIDFCRISFFCIFAAINFFLNLFGHFNGRDNEKITDDNYFYFRIKINVCRYVEILYK